jgi:aspartyl protease family protein
MARAGGRLHPDRPAAPGGARLSGSCRVATLACALALSSGAAALDVNVVGLFPSKAVVQIDGGALQTLSVGQKTAQGVVLVSVQHDAATFEVDGQRMTLGLGHARMKTSTSAAAVKIMADERGQFVLNGEINGTAIRFTVDTGSTLVALPAREARRLGLDYRKGQRLLMNTANGSAAGYRVLLDTVRVGEVTVNGVDAVVMEGEGLPVALLGMSFLRRMDIQREGEIMTLTKRY